MQLLDRPLLASTPDRPSSAGVRDTISIELVLPQRCASVSRAFGSAMSTADKRYYAFAVRCEAIGAKSDMASGFQAMLPRCGLGRRRLPQRQRGVLRLRGRRRAAAALTGPPRDR